MTRLIPLFLFLAASILTGCSGDDGGSAAAPSPTSIPTLVATSTPTEAPTAVDTETPVPPTHTATLTPTQTFRGGTATHTTTPTDTAAPEPTETGTSTPTPEPGENCCGNSLVEEGEECDDGNAAGGDGCAANCTLERVVSAPMVHGETVQMSSVSFVVQSHSQQTFRVGGPTGAEGVRSCDGTVEFLAGEIPVTQRPEDVEFEPVSVPGVACACVRAAAAERCAPALISSRPPSCDLGPECAGNPEICGNPSLCLAAHGEGNVTSGIIGCAGLEDVDYTFRALDLEGVVSCVRDGGPGPEGAGFLFTSARVGTILGTCHFDDTNPDKGPDGIPCTDDDPESTRGVVSTSVQTTGEAGGGYAGVTTIQAGILCGPMPCVTIAVGRPFSCPSLAGDPVLLGNFRLCSATAYSDSVTGGAVATSCSEQSE